jgi:hypothetical protein
MHKMNLLKIALLGALVIAAPGLAHAETTVSGTSWLMLPQAVQKSLGDNTCTGCSIGKILRKTDNGVVTYVAELKKPGSAIATIEVDPTGARVTEAAPDTAAPTGNTATKLDTIAPASGVAEPLTSADYKYLQTLGIAQADARLGRASNTQLRILHVLINDDDGRSSKDKDDAVKSAIDGL